jgi:hypothetical protein
MNEDMVAVLHQCVKDTLVQSNGKGESSWDNLAGPTIAGMMPVMNLESL